MKNSTRVFAVILASAAVVGSPANCRATDQVMDHVRFEGKDQFMVEVPLNSLLARFPEDPDFEWQSTGNYKGYTAAWEVKDGALFLVSFEAKRDGKEVPLDAILPGRKLPVLAEWYTGRVRIPMGRRIEHGSHWLYGAEFERVAVLHIERGKVVKAEELKNARIKSPTEERDAERARNRLWSFPPLEAGTVQVVSQPTREELCLINVPPRALQRTPAWVKGDPEPPLSPLKAILRAETKSRALIPSPAKYTWEFDTVALKKWSEGRYYYEVTFRARPSQEKPGRQTPYLQLLVLMDGTVPEPDLWSIGDLARTARAGAFHVNKPGTEPEPAPWEAPDQGSPWSLLPWRARFSLLKAVAMAPKLHYEVEKLEVYPNGVWAEYAVTNASAKRKFFSPRFLHVPVRNAGLWDSTGEKWRIPQIREGTAAGNRQEFISIDSQQEVRYRVLISNPVEMPLKPFGLVEDRPAGRPKAVEYFIASWPTAYTRLTESGDSEVQVFAFGHGRVPVAWFDKPYPADWPAQIRLSGPKAAK